MQFQKIPTPTPRKVIGNAEVVGLGATSFPGPFPWLGQGHGNEVGWGV